MDRRKFLIAGVTIVGSNGSAAVASMTTQNSPFKEIESSNLILTPSSTDQWEITYKRRRRFRILQVTDTHFSSSLEKDRRTVATLDALIRSTDPDLIVHTGDFVNNDSKNPVTWGGVEYFNQLKRPWAFCFGNHDYPVAKSEGSRSLEEFRTSLDNCGLGFTEVGKEKFYCYRHDLKRGGDKPTDSFFYFQVGYSTGMRKIYGPQLSWFESQMKLDKEKGWTGPILVFVHIPLIEYDTIFSKGHVKSGFKKEEVHFDSDTGDSFNAFAASERVLGVFCGHDHVNNYFGEWKGIGLHYGRVSGWGGYGDVPRGGLLISVDLSTGEYNQRDVWI